MELELEESNNTNSTNQILQSSDVILIGNDTNNNLEQENTIENIVENEVTEESQNKFLQTAIGKVINTTFDVALRSILPNSIEDQIIDIKNTIINEGFKEGLNTAVQSAIDLGKSALGIVTGKFDNLSQAQTAIKRGGIIDTVSDGVDMAVKSAQKNELISSNTAKLIKGGKKVILDTLSSNIEQKFTSQLKSIEKVGKYMNNWNNYYQQKDLTGMEKEYKKIKTQLTEILPLETTISEARQVENIHNLIKNKGVDYELSNEELELISKLV